MKRKSQAGKVSTPILVALIGSVTTIIAALIPLYGAVIINLISDKYSYLDGTWFGQWTVTDGTPAGANILNDIIEFSYKNENRYAGSAVTDIGPYNLECHEFDFAINCTFQGNDDLSNLVGVAIFRKETIKGNLSGNWWQLASSGEIVGGVVTLNRNRPSSN